MRTPEFWYRSPGRLARLLAPFSLIQATLTRRRLASATPYRPGIPVICIGNLVAGGAGKTPTALAVAAALGSTDTHFLSRGHGGRLEGPVQVDPAGHTAADVGDEPLLLARTRPTWVARDRAAGARAAEAAGAGVLVLDDGFQNPSLAKDLSLLVVDGTGGFGNGLVIPAGPLREPVEAGLARADAVVLVGPDRSGIGARLAELAPHLPMLGARIAPEPGAAQALKGRRVYAFAGIGRPAKLFQTLRDLGAELVATTGFADHHPYAPDEIMRMVEAAASADSILVTTEKDWVRLPENARPMVQTLPVALAFDDPAALAVLLAGLRGGVR